MIRTPRFALLALALLASPLMAATTTAPAKAPAKPAVTTPAPAKKPGSRSVPPEVLANPKLHGFINDVPDTGQFLADTTWLVRVNDRVTTAREFVGLWFASHPEYRPSPDSLGRVEFLRSLINRDVMGLTALRLNPELGFEDRLTLRTFQQATLSNAVFQKLVLDSVKVSDDELMDLWHQYSYVQHFRHIVFDDRATAERVRRELIAGRIGWSAAVKQYNRSTHDQGPDGDIGWIKRDQLDANIAFQIYPLRPGETSAVVADREGFHIVQSVARKEATVGTFDTMRNFLRAQMTSYKADAYASNVQRVLMKRLDMVLDTAAINYVSTKFQVAVKFTSSQALGSSFEVNGDAPEFTPQDTARVLATWKDGGRYTVRELVSSYMEISPITRPSLNSPEAVQTQVLANALQPYMADYAVERGFDKIPGVVRAIDRKREELLVEHLYQDSVGSKIWVSKDERRAYYEANKAQYFTFARVDFASIVRTNKAAADSLADALRKGADPAAILHADSLAGLVSGSIQSRTSDQHGPYQNVLFNDLRPGDVRVEGPDRQGDFLVVKLLAHDPGRQLSFEESEQMIDESLQNKKGDEALQAMIARLKPRFSIHWRPELVMSIRLSDPSLD